MKLFKHIENGTFHLAEDTATAAPIYEDISSIKNWNEFGELTGADHKLVNDEIKKFADTIEKYDALETDEKQITLIRMVAPPTKLMFDDLGGIMPQEEHQNCLDASNRKLNQVFKSRDQFAFDKIIENVYKGNISLANAQHLSMNADPLRFRYVASRIEEDAVDTIDGIVDWIKGTGSFTPQPITALQTDTIHIARPTRIPKNYHEVKIEGSAANDGIYTVINVIETKTEILIQTLEDLPNLIVGGNVRIGGFECNEGYTQAIQNELSSIYEGLYGLTIIQ